MGLETSASTLEYGIKRKEGSATGGDETLAEDDETQDRRRRENFVLSPNLRRFSGLLWERVQSGAGLRVRPAVASAFATAIANLPYFPATSIFLRTLSIAPGPLLTCCQPHDAREPVAFCAGIFDSVPLLCYRESSGGRDFG